MVFDKNMNKTTVKRFLPSSSMKFRFDFPMAFRVMRQKLWNGINMAAMQSIWKYGIIFTHLSVRTTVVRLSIIPISPSIMGKMRNEITLTIFLKKASCFAGSLLWLDRIG